MTASICRSLWTRTFLKTTAYEKRIEKMEREKLNLDEKLQNQRKPMYTFEQMFEYALQFSLSY